MSLRAVLALPLLLATATVFAQDTGTVANTQPVINIGAPDAQAAETVAGQTPNTGAFVIYRSGNTNVTVTVGWTIAGSATGGVDFHPIPTSVTLGPGQVRAEIAVRPIDDNLVEGEETVVLRLVAQPCAQLFPPPPECPVLGSAVEAAVRIADNDFAPPVVTLETLSAEANEAGGTGTTPSRLTFRVRRHQNTVGALLVGLQWGGHAARGADYTAPEVVSFSSGQGELLVHATPLQDTLVEGDETVTVSLRPCASNTTAICYVVGTPSTGSGVIRDDDVAPPPPPPLPVISVETVTGETLEGSTVPLGFKVRRGENTAVQTVVYLHWGGTATRGVDYQGAPEQVVFPAGQTQVLLSVGTIQDSLVEGDETVAVSIVPVNCATNTAGGTTTATSCYAVGTASSASGVIHDDDRPAENRPPAVAWMSPPGGSAFTKPPELRLAASAMDPDGHIRRVTFLANNTPLGTVTNTAPTLASFAGANTPGLYEWIWQNPAPGEYHLQAEAADNQGAVTRSAPAVIRIHSYTNPPPTVVRLMAPDREAAEPGALGSLVNNGLFRVHREGDLSIALTVPCRIEGTASNGVDYVALPDAVVFAPGQSAVEIVIRPLADDLAEGPETVRLSLQPTPCIQIFPPPPECYQIGSPSSDVVVIHDRAEPPSHPPLAAILHPWQGQVFRAPADIRLLAEAWDCDGPVASVEFFDGERSLGLAAPVQTLANPTTELQGMLAPRHDHARFALLWTGVAPGRHVIRAVATDADGLRGVSRPVEIKVVEMIQPPEVTLAVEDSVASETALPNGEPDVAVFQVHRTGPTNHPLRVFLHLGGSARPGLDYLKPEFPGVVIPAGARSAPFVVAPVDDDLPEGPESIEVAVVPPRWLTCADGGHLLPVQYVVGEPARGIARLLDNDVPAVNHPPRIRLVRPEEGAVFPAPAQIGLAAEAYDLDGAIVRVEFLVNGSPVGSLEGLSDNSTNATYTLAWADVPAGDYELTAVATDNKGAQATSLPVHITVVEPDAPVEVEVFTVDPHASEGLNGNSGPDVARFRFRRDGKADTDLTVRYTVSGTASNGVDYARLDGVVVIPAGSMSALVEVAPYNDAEVEPEPETVIVTLSTNGVPGYVAGRRFEAAAYIVDGEDTPSVANALSDGELLVELPVVEAGEVSVQVSTNLVDWVHVTTLPTRNGRVRFVDPGAKRLHRRFYQVLPAPINLDNLDD